MCIGSRPFFPSSNVFYSRNLVFPQYFLTAPPVPSGLCFSFLHFCYIMVSHKQPCSMAFMIVSWPLSESFMSRLPSGLVIMSLATAFDCYDPSSEKHRFSCPLYHDKRQSVFSFVSHNVMLWQLRPNHGGHKPPLHRRTLPSNGFHKKLQNDAEPFPAADIWCCHSQMCSVWYSDRLGQEPVQCEGTFFLNSQNGCCQAVKRTITAQIKSNRSLLNQVLCNDIQPFLYFLTLQNLCMAEKGHDHVASSLSRPRSYRFRAFFAL